MGELRAKLDGLVSALHCSLGSLSHLQVIYSQHWPLIRLSLSFPWASTLTSDQKCFLYHMEMTANIHRVSFAYLLSMVKEMRKKNRWFLLTLSN